jgi:hypothetical protein
MPILPWPFSTSLHLKFQLLSLFCRTHVFVDVYSSGAPEFPSFNSPDTITAGPGFTNIVTTIVINSNSAFTKLGKSNQHAAAVKLTSH